MSDTIQSSSEGVSELTQSIEQSLEDYTCLTMSFISINADVLGSGDHDSLYAPLANALNEWRLLIASDVAALESISSTFEEVDRAGIVAIMGVGALQ